MTIYNAYTTHESDVENWLHESVAEVWYFENTHTLYIFDDHLKVGRIEVLLNIKIQKKLIPYTYLMTIWELILQSTFE